MGSGDPMFGNKVRLAALATTAVGAILLAGCSAGSPTDSTPPPSSQQAQSGPPDLMGAAPSQPSQAQDGLLGGPAAPGGVSSRPLPPPDSNVKTWRRADGTLVTAMRPIPNPKGSRQTAHTSHGTRTTNVAAAGDTRTWRRPDGTLVTAMRPVPNPKSTHHAAPANRVHARIHPASAAQPAPAAKPAPKPVVTAAAKPAPVKPIAPKTVAPAPAPVKAAQPAKPTTPLVKPPVVAAAPPAAAPKVAPTPAPAKPATKLEKLQAAVATEATNGAVLAAGESLSKNQPGQVTLSLPTTLGDLIKKEAAKLGLTKAAKKTSAYAELSGEGYEVTPNGRQSAVVKPGEPTTFAWQVKPGPEAKGQLKSDFGVELNGAKPPQEFALGTITKRVAALPEQVKKSVGGLDLGALNGSVNLPGLGATSLKAVLGGALVLLAVIILAIVSRSATESRRRAERQRKYRTLTDYGRNEMEFEPPQPAQTSYVNPFVAAGAGAAAGAAATAAVSHHDEPAPDAQQPFSPFDAPQAPVAVAHPEPHAHASAEAHDPTPEPTPHVNAMVAAASPSHAEDKHDHADHGQPAKEHEPA